jgi:hypothetical protein
MAVSCRHRGFPLACALVVALWLLAVRAWTAPSAALPDDATLEGQGARIGTIRIVATNIFDLKDPKENHAFYRLANRWHTRTREAAIRAQLLFRSGQPYSRHILEETERNLRQLGFIREPQVRPVALHEGRVDVEVRTHDVWTLQLGPQYARSGGTNEAGFSIQDINLLGYGKTLQVGSSKSVDRSSTQFNWTDPNVLGIHWQDTVEWRQNSDGYARQIAVGLPFYALESRHSTALSVAATADLVQRYRLGASFDNYRHALRFGDVNAGSSMGLVNDHIERLTFGWRVEQDRFSAYPSTRGAIPADRKLSYPYLQLDWTADRYQTTRDVEQIDRTEDQLFGVAASLMAGWAMPSLGADRSAGILASSIGDGWHLGVNHSVFLTAALAGRMEHGHAVDVRSSGSASWYWRTSEQTLLNIKTTAAFGHALDLDHVYSLGGDNGLRGYPLRYQMGSSLMVWKVEERLFTHVSWWRLFDVGAAAFMDVGRTWGSNPVGDPALRWLKDLGIGLRLGNSRSSLGNVIHVDLATPLDGAHLNRVQLLVQTEVSY